MKTSNLLNFRQNKEQMYSLVETYVSKGNYVKALSILKNICAMSSRSLDAIMYKSEILSEIQLYSLANQQLFFAIGQYNLSKLQLVTAYHDISQNYLELDELTLASYYMRKVQSMVGIDDSTNEAIYQFEGINESKFRCVHPMSRKAANNIKEYAARLQARGEFDKSITMLTEVNEYFPHDLDCTQLLSLSYLGLKKYDKSEQLVKQILATDSDNIEANCNLAIIYYYTDSYKEMFEQVDFINNFNTQKIEHIYRIAMTMCECFIHEYAYKWLSLFIDYKPFDVNVLLLYAISCYNTERYQQSKEILLDIITLSESDVAEYFLAFVTKALDSKPLEYRLEYSLNIPRSEIIRRSDYLDQTNFAKFFNDEKAMRYVYMLLRDNSVNSEYCCKLIEKIFVSNTANDTQLIKLFKQYLLDNEIDAITKQSIIICLLALNYSGKLYIVNYGFLIKHSIPSNMPNLIKKPLIHAIGALCCSFVFDDGFIKHLVKYAEKMELLCISYHMTDIIDNTNLCAALLVRQLKLEAFSDKEICKKFNIDYRQLVDTNERIVNCI